MLGICVNFSGLKNSCFLTIFPTSFYNVNYSANKSTLVKISTARNVFSIINVFSTIHIKLSEPLLWVQLLWNMEWEAVLWSILGYLQRNIIEWLEEPSLESDRSIYCQELAGWPCRSYSHNWIFNEIMHVNYWVLDCIVSDQCMLATCCLNKFSNSWFICIN